MNAVEAAKHVLLQSGAAWILWLLAALSIASAVVGIERALYLRARTGPALEAVARELAGDLAAGAWASARERLRGYGCAAGDIAAAGLELHDRGPAAVEKAMQSAAGLERARLERRLAFLGTVGNNAPFVGLFGTVVGIIHAFEELGHAAPGHGASAAGAVASQAVMSSIAEALVATAVGILVALPAVAAYNYLQRRVVALVTSSQVLGNLILAYVASPAQEGRRVA